jgi:hypothetical protein
VIPFGERVDSAHPGAKNQGPPREITRALR